MHRNWILNASPIILLGKADLLQTISPLAKEWLIPEGVMQEVNAKGTIDSHLADFLSNSNVTRVKVASINTSIAAWDLGHGESEVLSLSLTKSRTGVVLDDLQARKCATLFDIPLIGSLGLIVLAKRKGLLKMAKPGIDRLVSVGLHIDTEMITKILYAIGEKEKP